MPDPILEKITADVMQALADPKVVMLEDQGLSVTPMRGAALKNFIDAEMKKYQAIVTETGSRLNKGCSALRDAAKRIPFETLTPTSPDGQKRSVAL